MNVTVLFMGFGKRPLTYFDAFHLGLTATPAGYIDRNTFNFYQCRNEQPDFSYPIQDAFKSEYLVRYTFAKGITEILADGAEKDGVQYDPAPLSANGRMKIPIA